MNGKRKAKHQPKNEEGLKMIKGKSPAMASKNASRSTKKTKTIGESSSRARPAIDDVDDAFVDDGDNLKSLTVRTSPLLLIKSFSKMNEAQKNGVIDMGFGPIMNMKLKELPMKLAYWLLENFDENTCELIINNGNRRLHIEEEDVWLTLGMPKGNTNLKMKTRSQYPEIYEEWNAIFSGHDLKKISPSLLSIKMLQQSDGGDWFKRHFLLLMAACLIEGSSNAYIQPRLLLNFEDISSVKDFNWCSYVLKVLVDQKGKWALNKTNKFLGPISFILAFYVDRVTLGIRTVPRTFPIIKGWTYKLLRQRQSNEIAKKRFGIGYPCDRYSPTELEINLPVKCVNKSSSVLPSASRATPTDPYSVKVLLAARKITNSMIEFMTLLEQTPEVVLENPQIKKIMESTNELLGRQPETVSCTPSTQDLEDIFWKDADLVARYEEEQDAARKTNQILENMGPCPNFSIGLTPLGLDEEEEDGLGPQANNEHHMEQMDTRLDSEVEGFHDEEHEELDAEKDNQEDVEQVVMEKDVQDAVRELPDKNVAEPEIPDENDDEEDNEMNRELRTKMKLDRGKAKVIDKENVVKRSTREPKKPDTLLSPFIQRIIQISNKLDKVEKDIYIWAFHNSNAQRREEVFSDGEYVLRRSDIETLAPRLKISTVIVDVWCKILNHKERSRAPESPYRFFATTLPCMQTIVGANLQEEPSELLRKFSESLHHVLAETRYVNLSKVDLVFFPIILFNHCFVICLNMLKNKVDIIDNSDIAGDAPVSLNYGVIPNKLKYFFMEFLKQNELHGRATLLKNSQAKVLQMPWRESENKTDCGVFTMRHMETYMGESQNNWKSGLRKGWKKQLSFLRAKYTKAILLSELNIHREHIKAAAHIQYIESSKEGKIDLDDLIMNTTYKF